MKTLPLSEVKMKLSKLVDEVDRREGAVTITKNGRPAAVLISSEEYEGWKETQEIKRDPEFLKEIKRGIAKLKGKKGKWHTFEEVFGEPL